MHPLAGANLGTLAAVFGRAGGVAGGKLGDAALIWLAALGRWPATALERAVLKDRLPAIEDMPAPVFILGHWRSGTTHLYNIMAKADFGYVPPIATGLPWDLMGIGKTFAPLLEKALPEHRYIDKIPVRPDSPQEDEIALANMTATSFYHGVYFPKHLNAYLQEGVFFDGLSAAEIEKWKETFFYLLRKLYVHQDRKRMLIKNPVYTARLAYLREILPQAKFIHIHRNPYDVFRSMRNFYKKLLAEFALQDYADADIDEAILSVYERMMTALVRDAEGLPANAYVELRYDHLDNEPLDAVETIYRQLELPGFDAARPTFAAYLDSVKTFEKNKFSYTDEAAEKVEARWGEFLRRWDYGRPGAEPKAAAE